MYKVCICPPPSLSPEELWGKSLLTLVLNEAGVICSMAWALGRMSSSGAVDAVALSKIKNIGQADIAPPLNHTPGIPYYVPSRPRPLARV